MKKLSVFIASFFSYLFFAPLAFAQKVDLCNVGVFDALCRLDSSSFGSFIGTIINLLFVIAVVIAVLYFIWGGIKWVMSRGEKEQVEAARNQIVASVVGLIVIFLAFFIINIALGFFVPEASLDNLQLPTIDTSSSLPEADANCNTNSKYSCDTKLTTTTGCAPKKTHIDAGDSVCNKPNRPVSVCCRKE